MENSFRYSIIIGASISILSSALILLEISLLKYKDLANKLTIILISTDLLMPAFAFTFLYPLNDTWCIITTYIAVFIRDFHKLVVLFISFSMYLTIVKNKPISYSLAVKILSISLLIGAAKLTIMGIFEYSKQQSGICTMATHDLLGALIMTLIFELCFDTIILIFIIILYYQIRVALMKEAMINDLKCVKDRIFAKRLIGYGLVFIFYFIPYFALLLLSYFNTFKNKNCYVYLAMCFYAWYPFFDSIIYGCTKSFQRNLFNICIKSPEFDMQEDALYILRNENMIRPRFYLDLIGESERIAL